ncbi:bacteriophage replication protein A [mine drainage metagenome]|uniref:Bacteriophage replication protein A n=1 Tax=mine drainage metagenome TaxID=410659 RepID=A0A1J5RJZ9_9ZZZZ
MQPQFNSDLDKRAYAKQMRMWHQPNVTPEVIAAVNEPLYRPFVASTLAKVPVEFHPTILTEYVARSIDGANQQTNTWLRESTEEAFAGAGFSLTASDDEISRYADNQADMVRSILASQLLTTPEAILGWIESVCNSAGINAPKQNKLMSKIERVRDAKWWRRSISRQIMQRREAGAIKMGLVNSRKGLYISDHGLERQRQRNKRSRDWLQGSEMVNELGEAIALEDIFNAGVSNPKVRFVEMAIRAKGYEFYAKQIGYIGLFLTTTCPSRMHERHRKTGRHNKKYDNTTPKQAHQYLCHQWVKARAAFKREGIEPLFIRIAEPHHDATPHWHMLVFVKPEHQEKLIEIMRHYALEHDGNERGAKETRFEVKTIDPNKGSAVGYIIKYIGKNIDGTGMGLDYESDGQDVTTTVERVTAWARLWGIRQFQFSEHCPVTIYRELRKIRTMPTIEAMQPHWTAASEKGDFHGFINAMTIAPMKLWTEPQPSSRYQDEVIDAIRGIELNGERLETRVHTWVLRKKDGLIVPWTSVNNCTELGVNRQKNKAVYGAYHTQNGFEEFKGKYKEPKNANDNYTNENRLQVEGSSHVQ